MSNNSENLQKLQHPTLKNLDEMSQQTLDALKVVHSFESKPARSVKIREILQRKADHDTSRSALVPVRASSSPERRFQGSPRVIRPSSESALKKKAFPVSNLNGGHASMKPKREDVEHASRACSVNQSLLMKPSHYIPASTKLEDTSILKSTAVTHVNRGFLKSSLNPRGSSALPATRTKGSSTTYTASRLLQPTAASVAKVNPRVLQRPVSRGPTSSRSKPNGLDGNRSLMMPPSKPTSQTNIDRFANNTAIPNAGNNSVLGKTKIPFLKPSALPSTNILMGPNFSTPDSKLFPQERHLIQEPEGEPRTINPSLLILDHRNDSPAKTSTPARTVFPITETSPSMHSIDYSNFSNFSYVADWAKTPELAKQTLAQQQVDTLRLFGTIPPVDIDAIFGSEIKRQQRGIGLPAERISRCFGP